MTGAADRFEVLPRLPAEDVEPRFLLDSTGELAIVLEEPRPDSRWVALSDACRAWTNDGFLGGFAVAL